MRSRSTMFAVLGSLAALAFTALAPLARAQSPFPAAALDRARDAREAGLQDDVAWDVLRSLTTEVGPRLAGSPGDARAVAWALATMRRLGFQNVHAESVLVPHWVRGEARVEILSPWPQPLVACALGGSVATPNGANIDAEIVAAQNLDELTALGADRVRGRIVFFHGRMERTRDGAGYGKAVAVRGRGAIEAAKLGALAVVIRSIGTDSDRLPHTGGMRYDTTVTRIPAFALSNPDADLLERQLAGSEPVRLRVSNTSERLPDAWSANVVGEFPGRDPRGGIVLMGAHLDSWDLGQGAHDDGAGVAIMLAAAKLAARGGTARTLRVVLFANEEFGLSGGRDYALRHAEELGRHVCAMESDLGAFAPWGFECNVDPARLPVARAVAAGLEPLGVVWVGNTSAGDADTGPLLPRGVPMIEVLTDARPYFDLHHTANDTFDKVDPALLRANVAAYAWIASLAARPEADFGRRPITVHP